MPIFYSSKTGSGLKVVSTKCDKKRIKGDGLKILK